MWQLYSVQAEYQEEARQVLTGIRELHHSRKQNQAKKKKLTFVGNRVSNLRLRSDKKKKKNFWVPSHFTEAELDLPARFTYIVTKILAHLPNIS